MKLFLTLLFSSILVSLQATINDTTTTQEIKNFQKELNLQYKSKEDSPLTEKDRKQFKKHNFFKIDLKYAVIASIELTPKSDTFEMKTSTDRRPLYRQYGIANFSIDGASYKLSIYQNIKYSQIEGYENNLFLLFNDKTNGNKKYAGGRYINLKKPEGKELMINFNMAYNPYCHYNSKYSCPIPPPENYYPIEIKAGIKAYKKSKNINK